MALELAVRLLASSCARCAVTPAQMATPSTATLSSARPTTDQVSARDLPCSALRGEGGGALASQEVVSQPASRPAGWAWHCLVINDKPAC